MVGDRRLDAGPPPIRCSCQSRVAPADLERGYRRRDIPAPPPQELKLEPFDRVVLVFGLEWRPTQFMDANKLLCFAGEGTNAFAVVVDSLEHLEEAGLIEIRRTPSSVRYRRTAVGFVLAERLIRDGRISFSSAICD